MCDGTCICKAGWVGLSCDVKCVYDVCGVCLGTGLTCEGCDGVPNSGKKFDACNVCGGDNSTCAGCDGVPNSGMKLDRCGVCGGNGSSCLDDILCAKYTTCDLCTLKIGIAGIQRCIWCNTTEGCLALAKNYSCNATVSSCQATILDVLPHTSNQEEFPVGATVGVVLGVCLGIIFLIILLISRRHGRGPLHFELPDFSELPEYLINPLEGEFEAAKQFFFGGVIDSKDVEIKVTETVKSTPFGTTKTETVEVDEKAKFN